jgi:glucose/arabinose dehydrogenase
MLDAGVITMLVPGALHVAPLLLAGCTGALPPSAPAMVQLSTVAGGLEQPTDIQFVPNDPALMIVLQKTGKAIWIDLVTKRRGTLLSQNVQTVSEQGLLGLAFHPRFTTNGKLYTNAVVRSGDAEVTRITEWIVQPGTNLRSASPIVSRTILEQEQPYVNHNAGQLAFGPDGKLYIGFGDGGSAGDPQNNGQNLGSLLGKMLRVDVDAAQPYAIPGDNPFVKTADARPEIWAYGLRNPWRYSFDPKGRLIVADVGQGKWEEISIITRGANLGWRLREGAHPYNVPAGTTPPELVDPIHEYGREVGTSITGGYTCLDEALPAIRGRWIFADFTSGRVFAIDVDEAIAKRPGAVIQIGQWRRLFSTFGRDAAGRIYLADFGGGEVYRLEKP